MPAGGEFVVGSGAQQGGFFGEPDLAAGVAGAEFLAPDVVLGTAQATGEFVIVHGDEEADFASGPTAGTRGQGNAASFALGLDLADGAAGFACQDGVRDFAELFYFGNGPRLLFRRAAHARPQISLTKARGRDEWEMSGGVGFERRLAGFRRRGLKRFPRQFENNWVDRSRA